MWKVISTAVAVGIIASVPAFGYNVLVWNYDSDDDFEDPDTGIWIEDEEKLVQALVDNGEDPDIHNGAFLPSEILGYDIVFACLGWYRC
jgi:hypothetical protein